MTIRIDVKITLLGIVLLGICSMAAIPKDCDMETKRVLDAHFGLTVTSISDSVLTGIDKFGVSHKISCKDFPSLVPLIDTGNYIKKEKDFIYYYLQKPKGTVYIYEWTCYHTGRLGIIEKLNLTRD